MKKNLKKTICAMLACILIALCGLVMPTEANAASTYHSGYSGGLKTETNEISALDYGEDSDRGLYYQKSGDDKKKKFLSVASDLEIPGDLISDGSNVYYSVTKEGSSKTTVYRAKVGEKKSVKVTSFPSSYGELLAYNPSSKRFVLGKKSGDDDYDYEHILYSYKPGKERRKISSKPAQSCFQYGSMLLWYTNVNNDTLTCDLYAFDLKSGKNTRIASNVSGHAIVKGKLMYAVQSKASSGKYKYTVYRSDLHGKSRKTLGSITMEVDFFGMDFGETYATGYYESERGFQVYRFNYSTGKTSKVSYEAFMRDLRVNNENKNIYY